MRASAIARFDRPADGERYGDFLFRGGLVLRARGLSGLSALAASGDGRRIVALGDLGAVFSARLATRGDRLLGIASATLDRRLGADGRPVEGKAQSDAEGIAFLPADGSGADAFLVGVEGGRRLLAYRVGPKGPTGVPLPVRKPERFDYFVRRGGLEALAVAPPASPVAGNLFIFHEKPHRGEKRIRAWRGSPVVGFDPGAGRAPSFRFRPIGVVAGSGWSVTGAAFLPGGDLLLLERRYRGGFDIAMRIRRIGRDRLARDLLDGPVILAADAGAQIDNMEGIAVSAGRDGGVLVTLVSDDNANFLQRTLLLRFRLDTPVPRRRPTGS